jgi:hypothetical protein
MKVFKFIALSIFTIFSGISILVGVYLTLGGIEMFFEELNLINENLATGLAMSLLGLFIAIVSGFIFKSFILDD